MEFVNEMRKKGQFIMGIGHRVKSVSKHRAQPPDVGLGWRCFGREKPGCLSCVYSSLSCRCHVSLSLSVSGCLKRFVMLLITGEGRIRVCLSHYAIYLRIGRFFNLWCAREQEMSGVNCFSMSGNFVSLLHVCDFRMMTVVLRLIKIVSCSERSQGIECCFSQCSNEKFWRKAHCWQIQLRA